MLRITNLRPSASDRTIKLEGKLLRPWLDEVLGLFVGGAAESLPRLDLSGLTYVDRSGAEMLQQLLQQGVQIESCSPFVAELLHW
ncbi:MAG TPA: hypothetical protein VGM05_03155, partial [Planctomycetaceae bacterium]